MLGAKTFLGEHDNELHSKPNDNDGHDMLVRKSMVDDRDDDLYDKYGDYDDFEDEPTFEKTNKQKGVGKFR